MKINTDYIAIGLFVCSLMFLAFGYGIVAHKYDLFPYPVLRDAVKVLNAEREQPHRHFVPLRYNRTGVKVYDQEAIAPGVTLLTSYWSDNHWRAGIRLINMKGDILHRWNIDPLNIWPETPYSDTIAGTMNVKHNYVHGSYLFPDGDVLVNIEYLGLVRIDACGAVVWKLPYRTHHSISRGEDGNFWVSAVRWVDAGSDRVARFPGLQAPYGEDIVLQVSPDGKILQEISVLEALFDADYQYLLWKHQSIKDDITHINDVEALSSDIADVFPMFDSGDLVISLKHISTVAVMDQKGKIKWLDSQSFNRQHDADFEKSGLLVVFDNREDGSTTGKYLGGSAITGIRPPGGELVSIYQSSKPERFFTNAGGKHQLLDNGNRLITEARGGRVFEIDHNGRTLWEWIQQPYNDELVPEVMEGTRYNIKPEAISSWQCN